jgi:hypothetical protein
MVFDSRCGRESTRSNQLKIEFKKHANPYDLSWIFVCLDSRARRAVRALILDSLACHKSVALKRVDEDQPLLGPSAQRNPVKERRDSD